MADKTDVNKMVPTGGKGNTIVRGVVPGVTFTKVTPGKKISGKKK